MAAALRVGSYSPRGLLAGALLATTFLACASPDEARPAQGSAPPPSNPRVSSPAKEAAKEEEKTDYATKLVLSKVTARRIIDPNDRFMAMVSGEIKNTGDRPVSRIQMTVGFLDRKNDFLFEEKYDPLSASRTEGPLKPGSTRKWATAILVTEEWAGKVDVKVQGAEFARK